jgi:spermidine synthase
LGRRYFGMNQPNLEAIAADGRRWLQQQSGERRFDFVFVDAYRPPYIPFHLTTVEFFLLVRSHLNEQGVVAINVGRTDQNYELVNALSATLGQVFPVVYVIDEPGPPHELANSLVVAVMQPISLEVVEQQVSNLPAFFPLEFHQFAAETMAQVRPATPSLRDPIFTDDKAPVEQVVHGIIWDFVTMP